MVEAIVALGTNLGDKEANLRDATLRICEQETVKVIEVSSVYETEPMYYESQGWFLNCVVAVETNLKPRDLLERLQRIELEMGRCRGIRYGPRVIDLDVLFYGHEIVSESGLEVPHPRLAERPFVLIPLDEIRPGLIHPVLGKSISELSAGLKADKRVVKKPGALADLAALSPRRS